MDRCFSRIVARKADAIRRRLCGRDKHEIIARKTNQEADA